MRSIVADIPGDLPFPVSAAPGLGFAGCSCLRVVTPSFCKESSCDGRCLFPCRDLHLVNPLAKCRIRIGAGRGLALDSRRIAVDRDLYLVNTLAQCAVSIGHRLAFRLQGSIGLEISGLVLGSKLGDLLSSRLICIGNYFPEVSEVGGGVSLFPFKASIELGHLAG